MITVIQRLRMVVVGLLLCLPMLVGAGVVSAHPSLGDETVPFPYVGDITCPSPPANFNPLHASLAQLQFYGLPRRPAGNAAAVAHWSNMLLHAKKRVCAPSIATNKWHVPPQLHIKQSDKRTTAAAPYNDLGDSTSINWSGYAVIDTSYRFFETFDDWTTPCAASSPPGATAVHWVGLGGDNGFGVSNPNLWQGGTELDASGNYFWWENYPTQSEQKISTSSISVGCNDQVNGEVDWNYTYANDSYVYLANYTRNQYWSHKLAWKPSLGSAEWIDERSGCFGTSHIHYLANFGFDDWTYAQAADHGYGSNVLPITSYPYSGITMYDPNNYPNSTLAYPTGLFSDGKSFNNFFQNSGTATC